MKTPADIHDAISWRHLENVAASDFEDSIHLDTPDVARSHAERFRELATLLLLRQQTKALERQACALELIACALNFGPINPADLPKPEAE